MSKPRIKIYCEVDTLAHASTIKNAIQNHIVGKDIFNVENISHSLDNITGIIRVSSDIRFNSRTDRDELVTWIKDQIQTNPQVKTWVLKADVTSHLCTHDDASVQDCKTTEYNFEFSK